MLTGRENARSVAANGTGSITRKTEKKLMRDAMELKTLKQTCDKCNQEYEMLSNICFPCYMVKNKMIFFPKKTKWQIYKKLSWEVLLIFSMAITFLYFFGVKGELCAFAGFYFGLAFRSISNFFDERF